MAAKSSNRDLEKQQKWLEQMRRWEKSGLSQMEFCRKEGLQDSQFYSWRGVLKKRGLLDEQTVTGRLKSMSDEGSVPKYFVPVDVKPAPIEALPRKDRLIALEIVTHSGYVVRIP